MNNENISSKLKNIFTSRKTRKGAISVIILAIALAVVILLNFVTQLLVERFPNLKLDTTSLGTYHLQDDTIDYLDKLEKDVTINILVTEKTFKSGLDAYSGAQYFVQADELLKKMAAESSHVSLKFVDLSSDPTFGEKYENIDLKSSDSNTLMIVESGENYASFRLDECFTLDTSNQYYQYYGYSIYTATTIEQAVVTGILEVTTGKNISIDFITGSGENSEDYEALSTLLKKNAYEIKEVNLLTGNLNKDSKIAVLFAPTVDLTKESAEKLEKWLSNDGKYGRNLIYIPINTDVQTPNIDALLKKYGMKVSEGYGYCKSTKYMLGDYFTFIVDYDEKGEEYTKNLKNKNVPVAVIETRDIEITDDNKAVPLLSIRDDAGMVPFKKVNSAKADDYLKEDGINVAAIGTLSSDDDSKSNVVVFGSPIMFLSGYIDTSYNNGNYIVNMCNTISDRGDLGITISSAEVDNGQLGVITDETKTTAGIIFIGAIPAAVVLIGLIVFIRRRAR